MNEYNTQNSEWGIKQDCGCDSNHHHHFKQQKQKQQA